MTVKHRQYLFLASLVGLALIVGGCGPAQTNAPIIATSVALTVQAQNTQEALDTSTALALAPGVTPFAAATPFSTKPPPTAPGPVGTSQYCTASASFVGETVPDGTIMSPGNVFTKIWHVQNTGTCAWTSSWKLVYISGDLMGGATVFNFPQPASPGQTVDVPVIFTAPLLNGEYRGYWKIQSPWGYLFGDSGSGNAFWVDIVVGSGTPQNNKTESVYDITAVSYTITTRCTTANTFWHILVNLTSNGPLKATFTIVQSDGVQQNNIHMTFTGATTQTFDYGEWSQRFTSSPNARWVQVNVLSPIYKEWPHSQLMYLCSAPPTPTPP